MDWRKAWKRRAIAFRLAWPMTPPAQVPVTPSYTGASLPTTGLSVEGQGQARPKGLLSPKLPRPFQAKEGKSVRNRWPARRAKVRELFTYEQLAHYDKVTKSLTQCERVKHRNGSGKPSCIMYPLLDPTLIVLQKARRPREVQIRLL